MMIVSTPRDQVLERRGSVDWSQPWPRHSPPQDRELLPQSKVFEHQAGPWAHERPEGSEDGGHGTGHESSLTVGVDDVTAESRLMFSVISRGWRSYPLPDEFFVTTGAIRPENR